MADNILEKGVDVIKGAPKWAWIAAGGTAITVIGIRWWEGNRTDTNASDVDAAPDSESGSPTYTGTGSPGVVVPPVIIPPADSSNQGGIGLGELQGEYLGAVQDVLDMFSSRVPDTYDRIYGPGSQNAQITSQLAGLVSQSQGALADLAQAKILAAGAGAAPTPAPQITYNVAPPPAAPAQKTDAQRFFDALSHPGTQEYKNAIKMVNIINARKSGGAIAPPGLG